MCTRKIAVLLTVYNGMEWIEAQLHSLLNQTGVDVTIFISVDVSIDASEFFCREMSAQYLNVVVLPNQGKLGGAARNFFRLIRDVDFSSFEYISFADQDDIWQEGKLSHAVQKAQEYLVDAYSSNVTAFWPDGEQRLISKAQPQQQYDYMFESAGPGCTFVLTKSFALTLQDFLIKNEAKCQQVALHDWFIYAYARSNGYKWFIDPTPHMLYRQHAENVVGANVGLKAKLARWRKLCDGWLVEQALLIANILGYGNAVPMQKLIRYNFADRFWLIFNVTKLRRRLRDRVALALFLLLPLKR